MTRFQDIAAFVHGVRRFKPDLLSGGAFEQLVEARMQELEIRDTAEYRQVLQNSEKELERVADGVSVQESWMFRYPESFATLAEYLRERRAGMGGRPLQMLSVGCARGEEPVSMVITALHAGWSPDGLRVTALDASREAIASAREGVYGAQTLREPPAWALAWLTPSDDRVQVASEVRAAIDYHHVDVLGDHTPWPAPADVVFCRNLLIYLDAAARAALLDRIERCCAVDSVLLLGHAEQLEAHRPFVPLENRGAFAWRRVRRAPVASPPPVARAPAPRIEQRSTPPAMNTGRSRNAAPLVVPSARALADRGDLHGARRAAREHIDRHGPTADDLTLLGSIELALGRQDEARRLFRKAVYLDPGHGDARLQLELLDGGPDA